MEWGSMTAWITIAEGQGIRHESRSDALTFLIDTLMDAIEDDLRSIIDEDVKPRYVRMVRKKVRRNMDAVVFIAGSGSDKPIAIKTHSIDVRLVPES